MLLVRASQRCSLQLLTFFFLFNTPLEAASLLFRVRVSGLEPLNNT